MFIPRKDQEHVLSDCSEKYQVLIYELLVHVFGRPTRAEITLHHQNIARPDVASILLNVLRSAAREP